VNPVPHQFTLVFPVILLNEVNDKCHRGIVDVGGSAMKKFLLNGSFLSAIFSVFGLVRATVSGKRDWKLALLWISWIVSLVAIVAAISDPGESDEDTE
jgi:E3 ubiquitin-protein ligase DOA10